MVLDKRCSADVLLVQDKEVTRLVCMSYVDIFFYLPELHQLAAGTPLCSKHLLLGSKQKTPGVD